MPSAPPRACRCGALVPAGKRCPRCTKQYDRTRGTARERGYDSRWERESEAFLALPQNRFCACGCGRLADMVDHRIAHKGDRALFWDKSNWQAMYNGCNSRKSVTEEGGFGRTIADQRINRGKGAGR
jgi:5-methylcytosine-specific restriction endonuclease McrA